MARLALRRPAACALALGLVSACGFEPLRLWPLLLLALAGLIGLIARAPGWKQAALVGWLFGLGHFALGINWIATAFTYQSNMPAGLGWLAVVLLAGYLAVYPMLAALGAWWCARRGEGALVPAFAALWIITEWLRGWVFTGFPWNPLAVAALGNADSAGLAGSARWTGTYGLSGLVVLAAGLGILSPRLMAGLNPARRRLAWLPLAGLAMALVAGMVLPSQPWHDRGRHVPYSLVQPDIRQEVLNEPEHFEAHFQKTARLSISGWKGGDRLLLWPESGVPDYLREGYPPALYEGNTFAADPVAARARLGVTAGPGALLLTGATDLDIGQGRIRGARNVVTVMDGKGAIRASYAKAHLVPYGEYLPMRSLLEPLGLSRLVPGSIDFLPGPGPQTLDLGRYGKVGVQICYEIVFSGAVADRANRPDFVFNPSNDGWFGAWGPPQQLAQARLRAIEEGLPVLRATTTGISAVIAPNGVVERVIPRHTARRIDGLVPAAAPPTAFARWGNMLPLGLAIALLLVSAIAMRRRQS